jgi:hypothetical protein
MKHTVCPFKKKELKLFSYITAVYAGNDKNSPKHMLEYAKQVAFALKLSIEHSAHSTG